MAKEAAAEAALEEVKKTLPAIEKPDVAHELTEPKVLHLHRLVAAMLET